MMIKLPSEIIIYIFNNIHIFNNLIYFKNSSKRLYNIFKNNEHIIFKNYIKYNISSIDNYLNYNIKNQILDPYCAKYILFKPDFYLKSDICRIAETISMLKIKKKDINRFYNIIKAIIPRDQIEYSKLLLACRLYNLT